MVCVVTYHFTPFRRVIHSFIFSKLGNCCFNNTGDIFTIIQAVNNCRFTDALKFAADILGENVSFSPNPVLNKLLTKDELDFLEIYNEPVTGVSYIDSEWDPEEKCEEEKGDSTYYIHKEIICYNPLKALLLENEEVYETLIQNKIKEKEIKFLRLLDVFEELFGEIGYFAIISNIKKLRAIQQQHELPITVKLPQSKTVI